MSLANFSASELDLLVSLPYKVGVYISHADDVQGGSDDAKEMAALAACIKAITKLHEDRPFLADIMRQTLAMKTEWPRWASKSFHVPQEAQQAAVLLAAKVPEADLKHYRAALMEIATTVAQSYGEFDAFDEGQSAGVFGAFLDKITDKLSALSTDDHDHPMNVSAAEDSAISVLASALRG